MVFLSYEGIEPKIGKNCFVAENATIAGDVTLEEGSSAWFCSVIRAEVAPIVIGRKSNIQDNCTLHTDLGYPLKIGDGVSVGHNTVVHGATIESNCLIGMSATILNGTRIGKNCIIGAGALLLQDSNIPENSLVLGVPASVKRSLTGEEIERIGMNANHYSQFAHEYLESKKSRQLTRSPT